MNNYLSMRGVPIGKVAIPTPEPTLEPMFWGLSISNIEIVLILVIFIIIICLIFIEGLPRFAQYLGYLVRQFKKGLDKK